MVRVRSISVTNVKMFTQTKIKSVDTEGKLIHSRWVRVTLQFKCNHVLWPIILLTDRLITFFWGKPSKNCETHYRGEGFLQVSKTYFEASLQISFQVSNWSLTTLTQVIKMSPNKSVISPYHVQGCTKLFLAGNQPCLTMNWLRDI